MNARIVQAVIKLRRDNDYNYQKNGDKFIPANGEVCLVDTARKGLCAVIGDGKTTFNKLEYVNNIFEYGYFFEDKWYKDQERQAAWHRVLWYDVCDRGAGFQQRSVPGGTGEWCLCISGGGRRTAG